MSAQLVWQETKYTLGDAPAWIQLMLRDNLRSREIARLRKFSDHEFHGEIFNMPVGTWKDEITAKTELIHKVAGFFREVSSALHEGVVELPQES